MARWPRLLLTALAIVASTSFLSGTFIFRDTSERTFDARGEPLRHTAAVCRFEVKRTTHAAFVDRAHDPIGPPGLCQLACLQSGSRFNPVAGDQGVGRPVAKAPAQWQRIAQPVRLFHVEAPGALGAFEGGEIERRVEGRARNGERVGAEWP